MRMPRLDVPGLGSLEAMADSPPGDRFWVGAFSYRDGPAVLESRYYVHTANDDPPGLDVVDFVRRTMESIDTHLRAARGLLGRELLRAPERFGVDPTTASTYLRSGEDRLPFAVPEPTFYRPDDWQIRFAESPLPRCATFGISVVFVGVTPDRVDDLEDSIELE